VFSQPVDNSAENLAPSGRGKRRACGARRSPLGQGIVHYSFHRLFFVAPGVRSAVMLRTEPAAPSLPGPFGAAGFHPDATPYRLQQPFRLRRSVAPFLRSLHPVARRRAVM